MIYTVTLNPAIDETLEVETLVPGGTHRVLSRCRYPGGKGLNAARALGVFAEDCTALLTAGGPTGEELAGLLRREALPCRVYPVPQPTRVNLKITAHNDGLTTELNAPGRLGDPHAALQLQQELLELLLPGDCVVLCGSLPQDLPGSWYRDCIAACRSTGAKVFLDELRSLTQVVILSDTFEEFAKPLMKKLGWPTIFCNSLEVADSGEITGFKMRLQDSKLNTVKGLQAIGFDTIASGDSYNDLGMIQASKAGFLFRSTEKIKADYPDIPAFEEFDDLLAAIKAAL